jgi:hypothetical protein
MAITVANETARLFLGLDERLTGLRMAASRRVFDLGGIGEEHPVGIVHGDGVGRRAQE